MQHSIEKASKELELYSSFIAVDILAATVLGLMIFCSPACDGHTSIVLVD
jgi:hypothetical protein